jgi:hypothetical protein
MENEVVGLKDLYTREQFIEKSGALGQVEVADFELGNNIEFGFDAERGIYLKFNDTETIIGDTAVNHIVKNIGMPVRYADNTPAELIIPHLNYYYQNKMAGQKARILTQDGLALSFNASPREEFIRLVQFLDIIEKEIGVDIIAGYHKPKFGWGSTIINVVMKETFEVVDGDPLNTGIRFVHSFNEIEPTRAFAYTFRQWCANGAISMDKINCWSKRGKGEESFRKWVPSVITDAKQALRLEADRLVKLVDTPTDEHTSDILDHELKRGGIPLNVREEVRATAIDQPTDNLYDVWNVITRVTTHSKVFKEHPASLYLLEDVARRIADHSHICQSCHRPID